MRRVMVMLRLGAEHYRAGGDYGGAYGDAMGEKARLRLARRIAREHGLRVIEAWPMPKLGIDCVVMEIRDGRSSASVAAELTKLPGVSWSQPLNEFRMQSAAPAYNDRLAAAQPWRLASLHILTTGQGETIAITPRPIETSPPKPPGQNPTVPAFAAPCCARPEPARRGGREYGGRGEVSWLQARPVPRQPQL